MVIREDDDSDSGVDMSIASDTESVTSSNYAFRYLGRRRYHSTDSPYPLPNDEEEHSRLENLHYIYYCHWGRRNVLAPISSKATGIIDVGTGSGRWPIEVALKYKNATVTGLDLSPVEPLWEEPDNCYFAVADLTEGLPFESGTLDLVHSRVITAGVKRHQWSGYMNEILRVLKPGVGWAQCTELRGNHFYSEGDTPIPEDSALRECGRYLDSFIADFDIYWNGEHLEQYFRDAGFVDIQVKKLVIDIGDWRKDNPTLSNAREKAIDVHGSAYAGLVDALTPYMKDKYPDLQARAEFGERVKADFANHAYRLSFDSYTVIGRKPEIKMSIDT